MPNPSQKLLLLQEIRWAVFNMMMEERAYYEEGNAFSEQLDRALAELKIAQEILIAESFASGAMAWFDTSEERVFYGNPDSEALA